MKVIDNVLPTPVWNTLQEFCLFGANYQYGSQSDSKIEQYHFLADFTNVAGSNTEDVSMFLPTPVRNAWEIVKDEIGMSKLIRCYANLMTYGSEGYPHTDSDRPEDITAVMYMTGTWDIKWGGETVIYEDGEIIKSVLPKPNRIFVFPGNKLHAARGVSRICTWPRITLMFKGQ